MPVQPGRGPRPPFRTDITVVPFATVPVSATREMRISMSLSPTGRAAVVQTYVRGTVETEMTPVGRPFTVFRAELNALVSALAAVGPLLDAVEPEPTASPVHVDTSGGSLPSFVTGRERGTPSPEKSHA